MSIAQEAERQTNIPRASLLDRVLGTPIVKTVIRRTTEYLVNSSTKMVRVKGRENLTLLPEMLTPKTLLLIASGHQNHADALIPMIMADELSGYTQGVKSPISITLKNRKQGALLGAFYNDGVLPLFEEHNIEPIYVATENDVKKRKEPRTDPHEVVNAILTDISKAAFVFPEGKVEGGRPAKQTADNPISKKALAAARWIMAFFPSEDIKGLQQIENPSFFYFLSEAAQKAGVDIVVLPVAPHGTFRMLREKPTLVSVPGFISLIRQRVFGMDETLAELNIGKPFRLEPTSGRKGAKEQAHRLSDTVMRQIADLLPDEARGYYKSTVT